jgi:hypothetical protein
MFVVSQIMVKISLHFIVCFLSFLGDSLKEFHSHFKSLNPILKRPINLIYNYNFVN